MLEDRYTESDEGEDVEYGQLKRAKDLSMPILWWVLIDTRAYLQLNRKVKHSKLVPPSTLAVSSTAQYVLSYSSKSAPHTSMLHNVDR